MYLCVSLLCKLHSRTTFTKRRNLSTCFWKIASSKNYVMNHKLFLQYILQTVENYHHATYIDLFFPSTNPLFFPLFMKNYQQPKVAHSMYFPRFLCRHHIWRSLDPPLHIWSFFMKKTDNGFNFFFASFLLRKTQLFSSASFFFIL